MTRPALGRLITAGAGQWPFDGVVPPPPPPPPPPPTGWGATSVGEALGVSFGGPTVAKLTSWENWVGWPARVILTFGHNGLDTDWEGHESQIALLLDRFKGHRAINEVSLPLLLKAKSGQTQEGIGQTLQTGANGKNKQHFKNVGKLFKARNLDVRRANGTAQVAVRIGWESNLPKGPSGKPHFPWSTGGDTPGNSPADAPVYKEAFDEAVADIGSECDISAIDVVWCPNTVGGNSRETMLLQLPDSATVLAGDGYDGLTGVFGSHQSAKPDYYDDVVDVRIGNPNPALDPAGRKVTMNWLAALALATGRMVAWDECGLVGGTSPVVTDGGDNNPTWWPTVAAWGATWIGAEILAWISPFEYDQPDAAYNHKVRPGSGPNRSPRGARYPQACAAFLDAFWNAAVPPPATVRRATASLPAMTAGQVRDVPVVFPTAMANATYDVDAAIEAPWASAVVKAGTKTTTGCTLTVTAAKALAANQRLVAFATAA